VIVDDPDPKPPDGAAEASAGRPFTPLVKRLAMTAHLGYF
jgi:hypothetical protein